MDRVLTLLGEAASGTVVGVTLPVAAALFLYEWGALSGAFDAARWLRRAGRWQPALAAVLAAIPGCAGSIAVSRLFVDGVVDRASLLAAHLATSGDASFVLLVGRPVTALLLFAFALALAAAVGVAAFGRLGSAGLPAPVAGGEDRAEDELGQVAADARGVAGVALGAAAPAWYLLVALTGLLAAAGRPTALAAAAAIAASLALLRLGPPEIRRPAGRRGTLLGAAALTARDAAEITLWVAVADVAFEFAHAYAGGPLQALATGDLLPVAVLAGLIGAIPGCGPQIFLARLFTAGSLPLAAIAANTVGQHGDAIFPLLARDRRAAVWVTAVQAGVAVAVAVLAVRLLG
jgi:hypothetical protein